ncbi:MAG: ABC transporter ATP-binding protein, partial [Eubacterium sp.]|nr:ABC transporter ATP-binding protein [Eubacterium sp.]
MQASYTDQKKARGIAGMGRLIGKYIKPDIGHVIATIVFTLVQYGIQIFALLPESKRLIDNGVAEKNMDAIWKSVWIMLALTVGVGVCSLLTSYFSARATAGYINRLRNACFRKVESLTPQEFAALGESTLVTRTMADVTQMQMTVLNILRLWLIVPVMIILELIMIARLNLTIFFILFGFFAITVFFLVYFGAASRGGFEVLQKKLDRINLLMKERITGARPIRAFRNEELENRKTMDANEDAYNTAIEANRKINFLSPIALVTMSWVVVVIYLVGTSQIQNGMSSISELLLIFQYVTFFITSLVAVPFLVSTLPKSSVSSR